jgi:hypothetical protein
VPELISAVLSHGGDGAELRFGKGHRWETEGAAAVAAAGLEVTGIASSRTFGAEIGPKGDEDVEEAASIGTLLRCFLDARCERDDDVLRRAHAQVAAVQRVLGADGAVVIEPHPGYASVPRTASFCAETGARAVVDNLALQRLEVSTAGALAELGEATRVLHVKGFEPTGGQRWTHRPLAPEDLPDPATLAHAPQLGAVVVETRAGSQWRDLRLLRRWREESQ